MITKKSIKKWITIAITVLTAIAGALAATQCTLRVYGVRENSSDSGQNVSIDSLTIWKSKIPQDTTFLWGVLSIIGLKKPKKSSKKKNSSPVMSIVEDGININDNLKIYKVSKTPWIIREQKNPYRVNICIGDQIATSVDYTSVEHAATELWGFRHELVASIAVAIINNLKNKKSWENE